MEGRETSSINRHWRCLGERDKATEEETIEVSKSYLYSPSRPHIIGVCGHELSRRFHLGHAGDTSQSAVQCQFRAGNRARPRRKRDHPMCLHIMASPVCGEKQEQFLCRSLAPGSGKAKPRVCANLLSVHTTSKVGQVAALSRLAWKFKWAL